VPLAAGKTGACGVRTVRSPTLPWRIAALFALAVDEVWARVPPFPKGGGGISDADAPANVAKFLMKPLIKP